MFEYGEYTEGKSPLCAISKYGDQNEVLTASSKADSKYERPYEKRRVCQMLEVIIHDPIHSWKKK